MMEDQSPDSQEPNTQVPVALKLEAGLRREVVILVIGALIGSVPALLSSWVQGRSRVRETLVNRRMDAVRDYSTACEEHFFAVKNYAAVLVGVTVPEVRYDPRVVEARKRYEEASIRMGGADAYAKAVFGEPYLPTSEIAEVPSNAKDLSEEVRELTQEANHFRKGCADLARMWASEAAR